MFKVKLITDPRQAGAKTILCQADIKMLLDSEVLLYWINEILKGFEFTFIPKSIRIGKQSIHF